MSRSNNRRLRASLVVAQRRIAELARDNERLHELVTRFQDEAAEWQEAAEQREVRLNRTTQKLRQAYDDAQEADDRAAHERWMGEQAERRRQAQERERSGSW